MRNFSAEYSKKLLLPFFKHLPRRCLGVGAGLVGRRVALWWQSLIALFYKSPAWQLCMLQYAAFKLVQEI